MGVPINSLQIYGLDILTKSNDPPEDGSTCQLLYLQLPFNLNTTPTPPTQRKMEIERERERNLNKPLQEQEFTTAAAAAAAITTNKQTNKQTVYVLSIRKSWKMKCVTYFLING